MGWGVGKGWGIGMGWGVVVIQVVHKPQVNLKMCAKLPENPGGHSLVKRSRSILKFSRQ